MADRLAGLAVAALAALALVDASGSTMQPGALLVAAIGISGLVLVVRTRLR